MKRTLAIILSLCLLLAAAPMAFAEENSVLGTFQSTWDNYGLSKEPLTLTVGMADQDAPSTTEGNIEWELIKQATGIEIEWVTYDNEKFDILAAGGDLPDIISFNGGGDILDLINGEQVIDMWPYVEKYGENIKAAHSVYGIPASKAVYGDGEKLYTLASNSRYVGDGITASAYVPFAYNVRWDLYQAIGTPSVVGEDGYYDEDKLLECFKQMQDYAREVTGDEGIYALSGWTDWGNTWAALLPYSLNTRTTANTWINFASGDPDTYNYYNDAENSHYIAAVRFYNKAYRMGILDPEMMTMTNSAYNDKVNMGKVLVSNTSKNRNDIDQSVKDVFGENVAFFPLKGQEYYYQLANQNDPVGYGISFSAVMINVNCPDYDRAVALIDYLYTDEFQRTSASGVQGKHWDYDENGKPVYIGDALIAYQNNDMGSFWEAGNGNYKSFPYHKLCMGIKLCADGYFDDFAASADYIAESFKDDEIVKAYLEFYEAKEARYPGELALEWVNDGLAKLDAAYKPDYKYMPTTPDEIKEISSAVDSYFMENATKAIFMSTQEECEALIAEIVEKCTELGADQILEWRQGAYAESIAYCESIGLK